MTSVDFQETVVQFFSDKYNYAVEECAEEYFDEMINTEKWSNRGIVYTIRDKAGRFISWWLGD